MSCQNRRIEKCSLPELHKLCLEITALARSRMIAECLEIRIVSAVNQICRIASTMKKKFTRKPTVSCHRHPTEKISSLDLIAFKVPCTQTSLNGCLLNCQVVLLWKLQRKRQLQSKPLINLKQ